MVAMGAAAPMNRLGGLGIGISKSINQPSACGPLVSLNRIVLPSGDQLGRKSQFVEPRFINAVWF